MASKAFRDETRLRSTVKLALRPRRGRGRHIALLAVVALLATPFAGADTWSGFLTLGAQPNDVAVDYYANKVYVTLETATAVQVIDGANNALLTTIPVQAQPDGVAVNPGNSAGPLEGLLGNNHPGNNVLVGPHRVYVANRGSDTVSVINPDVTPPTVTNLPTEDNPTGVAVSWTTGKFYITNEHSDSVTVYDANNNLLPTINVGSGPKGIAVQQQTNRIFVANYASGTITVIDGATDTPVPVLSPITGLLTPTGIAADLVTPQIYVTENNGGAVKIYNVAGPTAVLTGTVSGYSTYPQGIDVDLVARRVVVTGYHNPPYAFDADPPYTFDGYLPNGAYSQHDIATDFLTCKTYDTVVPYVPTYTNNGVDVWSRQPCVVAVPAQTGTLIPVPYSFCANIEQTVPGAVPHLSNNLNRPCTGLNDLPPGCAFSATPNYGIVTCSPPIAPAPGTYWACHFTATYALATHGTVTGTTQCTGGPTITSVATYPIPHWAGDNPANLHDFPWTCAASFDKDSTGFVFCDEPDPPLY